MINPMEWSEAINNTIGFYLWTKLLVWMAHFGVTVVLFGGFAAIFVWASFRFLPREPKK